MKIYLSHKISSGAENVALSTQEANCEAARKFANDIILALYDGYSQSVINFYVPGGPTEEFVQIAYSRKYLTVEQILKIDCEILRSKDMVIVWTPDGDTLNGGRLIEYTFAIDHDIPCYMVGDVQEAVKWIRNELGAQNDF